MSQAWKQAPLEPLQASAAAESGFLPGAKVGQAPVKAPQSVAPEAVAMAATAAEQAMGLAWAAAAMAT